MRHPKPPEAETRAQAPTATLASHAPGERLIRLAETLSMTGESRSTCYENIAAGIHPAPLKDGRASLWRLSEIDGYVRQKIARLPRKG
jgi:predicted DNA-binding transcriptional regulator AlpA